MSVSSRSKFHFTVFVKEISIERQVSEIQFLVLVIKEIECKAEISPVVSV